MTEEQKKYPVLCAWCEKEGERTILGLSTVEHSHGICPRHADELKEQARRYAAAICKELKENSRKKAQKTQEARKDGPSDAPDGAMEGGETAHNVGAVETFRGAVGSARGRAGS